MDEKVKLRVVQWSVQIDVPGNAGLKYTLCTGYDPQSVIGVIEALLRPGMSGPQSILIEVIREP